MNGRTTYSYDSNTALALRNPAHNASGQNATGKMSRTKCHTEIRLPEKMPQRQKQPWTKCHCLILPESNGDTVENTPQDSRMLLNAGINVQTLSVL